MRRSVATVNPRGPRDTTATPTSWWPSGQRPASHMAAFQAAGPTMTRVREAALRLAFLFSLGLRSRDRWRPELDRAVDDILGLGVSLVDLLRPAHPTGDQSRCGACRLRRG